MSTCSLIFFRQGIATEGRDYPNSWHGAAAIWTALDDHYLHDPADPYRNWLTNPQPLWDLAKRRDLPMFDRVPLVFTFDRALVHGEHFRELAQHLRDFHTFHGLQNSHLTQWAADIQASDAQAVALHATSVNLNPWLVFDGPDDDDRMYFGRYNGQKLGTIPDDYWRWFLRQDWCDEHPALVEYANLIFDQEHDR